MPTDAWHLTEDVDEFLARARGFLHSRAALHNTPLTLIEKLRAAGGADGTVFGRLERAGEVSAVFYLRPSLRLGLTPLSPGQTGRLAEYLAGLGHALSGVTAEHDTAAAFAEAWHQRTNASPTPGQRLHLYRLGTLTPPEPRPAGRGRAAGEPDRAQLIRLCNEFVTEVGEVPADSWESSRFADRHFTFWEAPDGTPVSLAARTSMIAGMVRVDPVYTPAQLRGHGYAGAVTVEVSRAALAAGARDVVLYTDPANATSNALYRRIGYARITDFAGYDFS
ncbi:GNAT family N-acetyltransferase [Amycolatopsis saalfeldensis]|uniref:Predicted acetyltransferase, GNAT family n=1 Tax=Amycolatopsis saalfeldensis TaxID=394193 RepID=A0A1H8YGD6_9PSEU|nr:GNAT family N-acetyltransferase [Amycolatopsis saalfeldensis]SEP50508.1 Predicted acetyltransferase, GNAT family [Amycolatopsis saalfeldensis]